MSPQSDGFLRAPPTHRFSRTVIPSLNITATEDPPGLTPDPSPALTCRLSLGRSLNLSEPAISQLKNGDYTYHHRLFVVSTTLRVSI